MQTVIKTIIKTVMRGVQLRINYIIACHVKTVRFPWTRGQRGATIEAGVMGKNRGVVLGKGCKKIDRKAINKLPKVIPNVLYLPPQCHDAHYTSHVCRARKSCCRGRSKVAREARG